MDLNYSMRLYFLITSVLIFFSCSPKKGAEYVKKIEFSDYQLKDGDVKDLVHVEEFIQLNVPDSILIGKVVQMEFSDSQIFLLEDGINSSILVFDREGVFNHQLLKLGTGPGEYSQIEFFVLRENSIIVYDRSYQKLITYSIADFTLIQEYKTQDYFMGGLGRLPEDHIFFVSDSELESEIYKGYVFFDENIDNITYFPQFSGNIEAYLQQSISSFSEKSYLVQPFSNKVFQINKDSLKVEFQLDFGSNNLPEEVSELIEAEDFWAILERGSYNFAVHNLLMREGLVSFNFFRHSIEELNFGIIDGEQAFRISIDTPLKELFLKPITVREDLFQTVLLPGEFGEDIITILNETNLNYEKPILVSYYIES